jgi:hypothetical protein
MARLFNAASAAALSLIMLAAAPVGAQEQTADAVMAELAELGIDTDGMALTDEQVLAVQAVLSDAGTRESDKVAQIETLLAE